MKRWLLLLLCACHSHAATTRSAALHGCRLKGVEHDALCGTVDVFEDRVAKSGRVIHLNVAIVPALAPTPEPDPLFVLAGGPGQAAVALANVVVPMFEHVLRQRDIVLVDQRGTGKSNPLDCESEKNLPLAKRLQSRDDALLKKCLAGFDADPRLYTTEIAMDDLDDVRAALGYDKLNLWGASYGTRAALAYTRMHGAHVRTQVIDGVTPPDMRLPLTIAADADRAMELLFAACSKDDSCTKTFPNLRARFLALLTKLKTTPVSLTIADPLTGAPQPLTIDRGLFTSTLRGELYVPDATALVPYTIARAEAGDFAPFVAQAESLSGGFASALSIGLFFSIICAEDSAGLAPHDAIGGHFFGAQISEEMLSTCAYWPRGQVSAHYRDAVRSDVPTLLLSGELDPVTPPEHAAHAAETLSQSQHMIVPGVGHGVTHHGCVAKIVADFITRGNVHALDTTCAQHLERPPFFVSFAGPTP